MSITTAQEVKHVLLSEDLLHPGDFILIANRESIRQFQVIPIEAPGSIPAHAVEPVRAGGVETNLNLS